MNRYLIAAVSGFLLLGMVAAWNGRRLKETLQQTDAHVVSANQQRLEVGKLNAGFSAVEGRTRLEDSVVALAARVAPWMVDGTPGLAGMAAGQASVRRTVWQPKNGSAEQAFEVFDNAQTLAAGHFDLALVMVFALPLVILFAPRQEAVLLALGPVVSLVGALMSGAPLGSADTWMRIGMWVLLTSVYGLFWVLVRRQEPAYWMAGVVYVALVVLVPGVAMVVADIVLPAPSRMEFAAKTQAALQPVMDKTSRELAPYYESHPEFATGEATPAEYDRIRLAAEAEWRAAREPLEQQAESQAATHRMAAEILSKLSPAATLYSALLETAGTGVQRQAAFEDRAREFGRTWTAAIKARMGRGHPLRPGDLDQLPKFASAEQPLLSWLLPSGIGLLCLFAWLVAARATYVPKKA